MVINRAEGLRVSLSVCTLQLAVQASIERGLHSGLIRGCEGASGRVLLVSC